MNLAWFLARKHLTHRRVQSVLTVLGVAVGIMVLTTALSLTNGFTKSLIDSTLSAYPHLTLLLNRPGHPPVPKNSEIVAAAPFYLTKVLLTRPASEGRSAGVDFGILIGVGAGAAEVYPGLGLENLGSGQMILGSALAANLGAYPQDRLFALSVNQDRSEARLSGTFGTGNYLLDSQFIFAPLADVQALLRVGDEIAGYHIRLRDPERAPAVGRELAASGVFFAQPWQDLNRTLIEQMALQKQVIGIVVFLIVVVAAIGIANVLVLVVLEKTGDIAILRVLGASRRQVASVFALEGMVLGVAGVILGNLLGFLLSSYFAWRPLQIPGDFYFLSELPVDIQAADFIWASLLGLATVLISALLPLLRALRVKPGEILR